MLAKIYKRQQEQAKAKQKMTQKKDQDISIVNFWKKKK